jgi:transcriptional regulator with PAS, ATPase and Fis domain
MRVVHTGSGEHAFGSPQLPVIVGSSRALQALVAIANRVAATEAKVLITGESGVGKDVFARHIHLKSPRAAQRFVALNCAAFSETLLESELFGHVKGSFTGAYRDKMGKLQQAHRGTIFLDEIGEMSLRMQALLLRFLETGEIQRVGSDRRLPALDVRVITATHRRLLDRIADQSFREDLYYRLNVIHIEVPPLRERREDVPVLLNHFLRTFSEAHQGPVPEVTGEALRCLEAYPWPGNIRELKNVAERLVLRCRNGRITEEALPPEVWRSRVTAPSVEVRQEEAAPAGTRISEALFDRLLKDGDSFWSAVYEPFMARDLTRADVRELIRMGLEHTRGNYKLLVTGFNMPPEDYKRFLNFLRKYECHVPFQRFRMLTAPLSSRSDATGRPARA